MIMAYDDSNAVIVPNSYPDLDPTSPNYLAEVEKRKQLELLKQSKTYSPEEFDKQYVNNEESTPKEKKKGKWRDKFKKYGKKVAVAGAVVGAGALAVAAPEAVAEGVVGVVGDGALDDVGKKISEKKKNSKLLSKLKSKPKQKQSEKPVEAEEPIQTTPKTSKSRNQSGKRKSQSKQTVHTEDVDLDEYLKDWQTEEKYDPVAEKNARENVLKLRKMMDNDDLDFDPEELEYYETELKKQIVLKRKIKGPVKSQPKQSRTTQTTPKKKKSVKSSGKRTTATKKKSATTKRKTAKKKTQSAPKKKVEKDPYDGLDWL